MRRFHSTQTIIEEIHPIESTAIKRVLEHEKGLEPHIKITREDGQILMIFVWNGLGENYDTLAAGHVIKDEKRYQNPLDEGNYIISISDHYYKTLGEIKEHVQSWANVSA